MAVPSAGLGVLLLAAVLVPTETTRIGPPRPGVSTSRAALPAPRFVCSPAELRGPPVMVHLTVSPLTKPRSREIELNWRHSEESTAFGNDTVTLTLGDPASARARRLVSIEASAHPGGKYRTNERFRHRELPHENMVNRCTEYWIGYFRGRQLLAKNCLKILPAWMWQNREVLSPMSLDQMMIPGTHNSGTYKRSRDIVFKLVTTQDEDVWSQLMFGNRYLDLRVGYRPSEREPFWVYHDFFPVRPINIVIKHLRWFLDFTKEVVILHFHRFPVGFDTNMVHTKFVQYLTMELGQWMAPRLYDVTVGELWRSDTRLIVSYNDWPSRRRNEHLWPSIPQAWGDKKTTADLYDFLREQMRQRSGGSQWAAMAELTPSPWNILIPNRGLRDLAQKVNSHVTRWFRDEWWHSASIVATDFFLGNDMIDVSIEANIKRRRCVAGLVSHRRRRGRRGRRHVPPRGDYRERLPGGGVSQVSSLADLWERRVAEAPASRVETRIVASGGRLQSDWQTEDQSGTRPQEDPFDQWTEESRFSTSPDRHARKLNLTARTILAAQDYGHASLSNMGDQEFRPIPAIARTTELSRLAPYAALWTRRRPSPALQPFWWTQEGSYPLSVSSALQTSPRLHAGSRPGGGGTGLTRRRAHFWQRSAEAPNGSTYSSSA